MIADSKYGIRRINSENIVSTLQTAHTLYSQMAPPEGSDFTKYYSTSPTQILVHPETQELYGGSGAIYKIYPDGAVRIAGYFSPDKFGTQNITVNSRDMEVGANGNIYVSDNDTHQIKQVLLQKNDD